MTWFDTDFSKGSKTITLSTSPYRKSTHWKQTIFYLDKPLQIKQNQQIKGNLNVTKAKDNPRELNVRMNFDLRSANDQKV